MRLAFLPLVLSLSIAGCRAGDTPNDDAGAADSGTGVDASHPDATAADSHPAVDSATMDVQAQDTAAPDVSPADARPPRDVVARDASLAPSPGQVYCFTAGNCMGGTPVCCSTSTRADGGRTYMNTCIAAGAACGGTGAMAGEAFACDDGPDCTGGQVCCATTGTSSGGTMYISGTACATSCAGAMQQRLCSSDADCGTGHCMAVHVSGRDLGYCM
jgi:hypothetical protein